MVDYGVTPTGFVKKPLDVIKTEKEEKLRADLGDTLNLLPSSVFGAIVGIEADREAEIWDLLEAVYNSQYPHSATGQSQDNVCAITGTLRKPATKSTATIRCNLNAGVTLPIGRVVSQGEGSDVRFVSTAAATNARESDANIDIAFEAEETGPIAAISGTLTHIETPVSGWNSATNPLDAAVGRNRQNDTELRVYREQQLHVTGKASLDAVISAVGAIKDVESVTGFENDTDEIDADGMPPHSIEILVTGGTTQDIVDAIWASKGGGIATAGSSSGTALDRNGDPHTVKFTRPGSANVYAIVDITTDPATWPSDGVAQIKAALVTHGDNLGIGGDVIQSALYENVFAVSGVVDVTRIWIGVANPPTAPSNIVITSRQRADFDTSRIVVNVS